MVDKAQPEARFGETHRWPRVMQEALGPSWFVIEEGLNGRTTDQDDPIVGAYRNGRRFLRTCLESHKPIDVLIFMLGTNDLKACYRKTAHDVGVSIGNLIVDAQSWQVGRDTSVPSIVVVSPPQIHPHLNEYAETFRGGYEKSLQLAGVLREVARQNNADFLDANEVAGAKGRDGVHMSLEAHQELGCYLARLLTRSA